MDFKKKLLAKSLLLLTISSFFFIGYVEGYVQIEPGEPQHIRAGEIPNLGPYRTPVPKEFRCYLEAGRKYHIFLVGDWITNSSRATDYDIVVRNPNNVIVSIHTEAAGLPERVTNDGKGQYFIPPQSGDYRFQIYNDPQDSYPGSADAADFMIIEHIEMNTVYKKYLVGKPHVGAKYPPGYKAAYSFNTTSPEFLLYIKVPGPVPAEGIRGLDMYEARVYPMADPENGIGYYINGVGVPFGHFMYNGGQQELYGGYNTEIDGFRYPDMRISCESAGVDMQRVIRMSEINSTEANNVFYYLVLLAEYFEGEVEFYIKTDYRPVNLTLIDPPQVGYTKESTLIKVETESAADIGSVWIEYSTDSWKTKKRIDLIKKEGYWLAVLPSFQLHSVVKYRIYGEDVIDNKGVIEGSFKVMNKVEIDFVTSGGIIQGGQSVTISGEATKPSINLKLNIVHGGKTESINIQTDGEGKFSHEYNPVKIGEYDVKITYAGDENYHSASSREKSFRVDKRKIHLIYNMDSQIKNQRPFTITGQVIPAVRGLVVDFLFVTPSNSFTETVTTGREGGFSLTINPEVEGLWDILPQLKVSELYDATQGQLATFEVQKLTIIDVIVFKVTEFTQPPLMYVPIGLGSVLTIGLIMKTGIIKRFSKEEEEVQVEEEEKPEGITSYKRRSAR